MLDRLLQHKATRHLMWGTLVTVVLLGDYATGRDIQFPILYILPVSLAAWFGETSMALFDAAMMPLLRLWFDDMWQLRETIQKEAINAAIQMAVLLALAVLVRRESLHRAALQREVVALRGLLPTCAYCKKIRDADDQWLPMEQYIGERTEVRFSHGICPACAQSQFGELLAGDGEPPAAPSSSTPA